MEKRKKYYYYFEYIVITNSYLWYVRNKNLFIRQRGWARKLLGWFSVYNHLKSIFSNLIRKVVSYVHNKEHYSYLCFSDLSNHFDTSMMWFLSSIRFHFILFDSVIPLFWLDWEDLERYGYLNKNYCNNYFGLVLYLS